MFDFRHARQLDRIELNQAKILALLQTLTTQEKLIMSAEDDLTAAVAAETTVEASATTAITGLIAQVAALTANGQGSVPAADVEALVAKMQASQSGLVAAIPVNTPAAAPPGS